MNKHIPTFKARFEMHDDGEIHDPDKGIYYGRITERIEFKEENKMKIECDCGKPMEDTEKKIWYKLSPEHSEDIVELRLSSEN